MLLTDIFVAFNLLKVILCIFVKEYNYFLKLKFSCLLRNAIIF